MTDGVADHYSSAGLTDRIREAFAAAGLGLADLDTGALAGVDEFHLGGRVATEALLGDVGVRSGWSVVNVGCGIGGAARAMAGHGCTVIGVDLTPAFVTTARELTATVGLDDRARFEVGSALDIPIDDAGVDLATMLHVGMNIEDKVALMTELARVVRPGGTVAVYDIMRIGPGELTFPVPWASEPWHSHVASPTEYCEAMQRAGFSGIRETSRLQLVRDTMAAVRAAPSPPVDLGHLMGPELPTMFANLLPLLGTTVAPIQLIARR